MREGKSTINAAMWDVGVILTRGITKRARARRELITMMTIRIVTDNPGQQSILQDSQVSVIISQKPSPQSEKIALQKFNIFFIRKVHFNLILFCCLDWLSASQNVKITKNVTCG